MIELQLLGGLRIGGPGVSGDAPGARPRPLALLAFVAAAAPQPVSRESVMAVFWPESNTARASNSIRQMVFSLRRDLHEELFVPDSSNRLQLNTSLLRVDLWSFRDAMQRGAYEDAAAAYGGLLLDGFHLPASSEFTHWVESERHRLAQQYLSAVDGAARRAMDEGRIDDAVRWRRRQVEADRFGSRAALALLQALAAAGDRPGALEYAARYEKLVRSYLEVDPDPAVMEFVAGLRAISKVHAIQPAEASAPTQESEAPPAAVEAVTIPARRPRSWLLTAASVTGVAILAAASAYSSKTPEAARPTSPPSTAVILGSGVSQIDGRDPNTRLIACSGPACPTGELPQNAFIVPKHSAYGDPVAGTRFIAPVADAIAHPGGGYPCCTTATFEREFTLPREAVSATITLRVLADNQARASINGVQFGVQTDSLAGANYSDPAMMFTQTFAPAPGGTNHLVLTLWDGGGALALHYHAVITYTTADSHR